MKKTLTVNLGGLVFNIDDDAFVILKKYLNTIKGYFENSEGRDEIMTDIESRIAEMLQEKMHGGKEVINASDINAVIVIMGQPEDYITDDLEDEPSQNYSRQESYKKQSYSSSTQKRLFRDGESNVVGGVCSGIGYYFGIDPIWIRLGFVLSVLFLGSGFLLYLILWIIMPEARTPSDKLAMKGEPVTFDNIGKTVEQEIKNVKKKLNNLDGSQARYHAENIQSAAARFGEFILSILKLVLQVFGKLLGIVFILTGVALLVSLFFGSYIPLHVNFQDPMEFANLVFASGNDFWLSVVGGSLVLGIPFLALVLAGFVMLLDAKLPKYTGLVLGISWVVGIILSTVGGISTGMDFSKESSKSEKITMSNIGSDTIYFDILDSKKILSRSSLNKGYYDLNEVRDGEMFNDGVGVDVILTKSKFPELEVTKMAHGKSYEIADKRAESLHYHLVQDSNTIKIDPYYSIKKSGKWRAQEVKVTLFVPVGTTVFIPKSYQHLLDDVKNYHNTYDPNMVEMYWTMTDSGLVSPQIMSRERTRHMELTTDEEFEEVTLSVSSGDETHSIVIK